MATPPKSSRALRTLQERVAACGTEVGRYARPAKIMFSPRPALPTLRSRVCENMCTRGFWTGGYGHVSVSEGVRVLPLDHGGGGRQLRTR